MHAFIATEEHHKGFEIENISKVTSNVAKFIIKTIRWRLTFGRFQTPACTCQVWAVNTQLGGQGYSR